MYINFDERGYVIERVSFDNLRQASESGIIKAYIPQQIRNNTRFNTLSVSANIRYFDDEGEEIDTLVVACVSKPNEELPFDSKQDLKVFEYHKLYDFWQLTIPTTVLQTGRSAWITFVCYDANDNNISLQNLAIDIERQAITETEISKSEYNYLLAEVFNKVSKSGDTISGRLYLLDTLELKNGTNSNYIFTRDNGNLQLESPKTVRIYGHDGVVLDGDTTITGTLNGKDLSNVAYKNEAQTFTGKQTFFGQTPSVSGTGGTPSPVSNGDLTTKKYVDDLTDELDDRIESIKSRGRYLSIWNATTGVAGTEPPENPYTYKNGDYFIVSVAGNKIPKGTTYDKNNPQSETYESVLNINDTVLYDGTVWKVLSAGGSALVNWGNIVGDIANQNDLQTALADKQDTLTAGDNITIEDGVISATGKVYTAGKGISIDDDDEISADLDSTDIAPLYKNVSFSVVGDNANLTFTKNNDETKSENLPLANDNNAGLMSPNDKLAITSLQNDVANLKQQTVRLLYTIKDNPTSDEIKSFVVSKGYTDESKYGGIAVVIQGTNHIWKFVNATVVSGVWVFKDELDGSQTIEAIFTSNSVEYDKMYNTDSQFIYEKNHGQVRDYAMVSGVWQNEAYKTIDFGDTDVSISNSGLTWLIANTDTQGDYNFGGFVDFGLDTVSNFTNDEAGVIKGSNNDGQVYAETNGTGSVNGWDKLNNDLAPQYDNTATYSVGDFVMYATELYKCKTAITTAEDWDSSKWDKTSVVENLSSVEATSYNANNTALTGIKIGGNNYCLVPLYFSNNKSAIGLFSQPRDTINQGGLVIGTNATIFNQAATAIGNSSVAFSLYTTAIGQQAEARSAGSTAIGSRTINYLPDSVSFDANNSNRFIQLYDLSMIKFRNENVATNKTTFASYTLGYTLAERLNGLTLTDNSITELDFDHINKLTLGADRTFTFKTAPTSTGTGLSCSPTYELDLTVSADLVITLPSGTYSFKTDDSSKATINSNSISLKQGRYIIKIHHNDLINCEVW